MDFDAHLWTLCTDHYFPRRLSIRTQKTKDQYRYAVNDFERVLGRPPNRHDLTDDNLTIMVGSMLARGLEPITVNERVGRLKTLQTWLAKRGLVSTFPTLERLEVPDPSPLAWQWDEMRRLFLSCRQEPGHIAGIPAGDWWTGLHCVLWDTGLRIGAAMRLEWRDVDWTTGTLIVPAESQKQKSDQRFRLHADTLAVLSLIRRPKGRLFPWDRSYSTLWHHYGRLLARAGLPCGRRDKFHRMRRSVASWFEACGGDATALLGHSSRQVTEAYLDETITGRPQASERLFRPEAG
jgi:integrase